MALRQGPKTSRAAGLRLLLADRAHIAATILEEAEQHGDADAAYLLGIAYQQLGRHMDAECAWRRILCRTTNSGLRIQAAEQLMALYRDLGGPVAYAEMAHYAATLQGPRPGPPPPPRIRSLGHREAIDELRGIRAWWRGLAGIPKRLLTVITVAASVFGLAEGVQRLIKLL